MNETVGVVRERVCVSLELKTGVFSFDAKSIKNTRKIYNKINSNIIINKKRINKIKWKILDYENTKYILYFRKDKIFHQQEQGAKHQQEQGAIAAFQSFFSICK